MHMGCVSPVVEKDCERFSVLYTIFTRLKGLGGSYFSILLFFEADLRIQAEGLYTTEVINGERLLADLKTETCSMSFIVQSKPDSRP